MKKIEQLQKQKDKLEAKILAIELEETRKRNLKDDPTYDEHHSILYGNSPASNTTIQELQKIYEPNWKVEQTYSQGLRWIRIEKTLEYRGDK